MNPKMFIGATILIVGCGRATHAPTSAPVLAAHVASTSSTPAKVDLGVVSPGGTAREIAMLTRPASRISKFKTSCDCLRVKGPQSSHGVVKTFPVLVSLDLRSDPAFSGDLRIRVEGLDDSEKCVLAFDVAVSVDRVADVFFNAVGLE